MFSAAVDMPNRPKITDVNPQIICAICDGYLIDATTLVECMHTFCRSCIVCYLEINYLCPVCNVQVHKARPLLSIRSDKTWQNMVYKMIPDIYKKEMQRRRNFYAKHPEAATCSTPEERGEVELRFFSPKNIFSLSLEHIRSSENPSEQSDVKDCPTCYLNCPAAFTVRLLKKFVRKKFILPLESDVDIFYESHFLHDSFTLMDVAYIYSWKRVEPMKLFFSISGRISKCLEPRSSSWETSSRICETALNNKFAVLNISGVLPVAEVKNADQLKVDFSRQVPEKKFHVGNTSERKLQYSRVTIKSPPSPVKPEPSSNIVKAFSASKSPFSSTNGKYLKFKRGPELKGKFYFSRKKSRKKGVDTPHPRPETAEEINSRRCPSGYIPDVLAKSEVTTELKYMQGTSNKSEEELGSCKFVSPSTRKSLQGEGVTKNTECYNPSLPSESLTGVFSSEPSNDIETSAETCTQLSPTKIQSFKLRRSSKFKNKISRYNKSRTKNSTSLPSFPKIVEETHPLKCSAENVHRVLTAASPSITHLENKQLKNLCESEEDARANPKKVRDDMSEPAKVSSDNSVQRLDLAKNIEQYRNPSLPIISNPNSLTSEPNTRVNVVYASETRLQQLPNNELQPYFDRSMTGNTFRLRCRQTNGLLRIARVAPYLPSMTRRIMYRYRPIAPKSASPEIENPAMSASVPLSSEETNGIVESSVLGQAPAGGQTQMEEAENINAKELNCRDPAASPCGQKQMEESENINAKKELNCREPAASPSPVEGVTVCSSSDRNLMSSSSVSMTKPTCAAAVILKSSQNSDIHQIEKLINRKSSNKLKSSIQLVTFGRNGHKPKTEGISWSRCVVIGSKVVKMRKF